MPNIKSAKKRMELSARARLRNRSERARIRTAIKRVRGSDSAEAGKVHLRSATALLDRAATRKLFHPNRVARLKSGLTKHIQSLGS